MPTKFKLIAAVLVLLGLILVLLSAYCSLGPATNAEMTSLSASLLLLLQAVGIAFIGFAIFGILADTRQWREYFSSRLREIMVDHEYLHALTTEKLLELQDKVWKVLYRNPNIGQQGTFLSFCSDTLHKFIIAPYRENVTVEIHMKACADPALLEVTDRVSHVCRSAGGQIQSGVTFCVDPGEIRQLKSLRITVKHPTIAEKALFENDNLTGENPELYSKECSLIEYSNVDGLVVTVESTYMIDWNVMQTWSIMYPTRQFDLVIRCPLDFDVHLRPFVVRSDIVEVTAEEGYGRVRYSSWMVPESGVAWQLRRRPQEAQVERG